MTEKRLRIALAILAAAGLAVSIYLVIVHYSGGVPVCTGGGQGCETVQKSKYAEMLGIPVALYGLVGYLLILLTTLRRGELAAAASLFLTVIGVGFSAYLTYLELAVIKAICQWCVVSAVIMVLALIVAVIRYALAPTQEPTEPINRSVG